MAFRASPRVSSTAVHTVGCINPTSPPEARNQELSNHTLPRTLNLTTLHALMEISRVQGFPKAKSLSF